MILNLHFIMNVSPIFIYPILAIRKREDDNGLPLSSHPLFLFYFLGNILIWDIFQHSHFLYKKYSKFFKVNILFNLWKVYNKIIFEHHQFFIIFIYLISLQFAMMLEYIQVYIDKMVMNLCHLHYLLDYWINAST